MSVGTALMSLAKPKAMPQRRNLIAAFMMNTVGRDVAIVIVWK